MRTLIAIATLAIAAAASHSAGAQTLASADNPAITYFPVDKNAVWPLDAAGTTSLTFKTTKPQEIVQLTLSGMCGSQQLFADESGGLQAGGYVQSFFVVDGVYPDPAHPFRQMCNYSHLPMNVGSVTDFASVVQQKVIVANPGLHSIGVTIATSQFFNFGYVVPVFGQTHLSVSK